MLNRARIIPPQMALTKKRKKPANITVDNNYIEFSNSKIMAYGKTDINKELVLLTINPIIILMGALVAKNIGGGITQISEGYAASFLSVLDSIQKDYTILNFH